MEEVAGAGEDGGAWTERETEPDEARGKERRGGGDDQHIILFRLPRPRPLSQSLSLCLSEAVRVRVRSSHPGVFFRPLRVSRPQNANRRPPRLRVYPDLPPSPADLESPVFSHHPPFPIHFTFIKPELG